MLVSRRNSPMYYRCLHFLVGRKVRLLGFSALGALVVFASRLTLFIYNVF